MKIRRFLLLALGAMSFFSLASATERTSKVPNVDPRPDGEHHQKAQIAILLDTSSSMDGLIEQAKTQLWSIVNTFVNAKVAGATPYVEVALYEYGNSGLRSETNWIRLIRPFTRDLDQVSDDLFKLTTNGGDEFCGAVIERAMADLSWDQDKQVYKAIMIAGNEPFTQGPINPDNACRAAAEKGIIVNTIHCGTEAEGINGGWRRGASLAHGRYLVINQGRAVVHVDAPQDDEIMKLNQELNKTYVGYGSLAPGGKAKQEMQDVNALSKKESGAALQRAVTKASSNYDNSRWDLVDAQKKKDFDVAKVPESDLPAELKGKTTEEKKAWVEDKAKERTTLQDRILKLNKEREAFVAGKLKEGAKDTLDVVVTQAVKEQAEKLGYSFGK